jgi:GNAT superfamily N-acetyltransferase
VKIERWEPGRAEALARFWNAEFARFPRFVATTAEALKARLASPGALMLAVEGDAVIGVAHAGVSTEAECRARVKGWPGGTQGYVALLAVAAAKRRAGIGTALWHAARGEVAGVAQFVVDGDGRNPWWSKPPAFGAPWGPAVAWGDSTTKKFLATRGYGPRAKAVEFADRVVIPDLEPEEYDRRIKGGLAKQAEWAVY